AGSLRERGFLAGRDGVPDICDRGAAVGAPGVQDRVRATDRFLNLRVVAEASAPAARRLLAGQFDQRVDPSPRDAGDDGTVMRSDPGLRGQRVRHSRPALPLIVERNAGVNHRAPLRQEDVVDGPVEAAGRAHPGDVPASLDDSRLGTREDSAPVRGRAVRVAARLSAVENLEAAQHPGTFLAARAKGPATGDAVTT